MDAKLYSAENKGRGVKSRWGVVQFDKDGFASLEVATEDDLQMLRNLKWLIELPPAPPVPESTGVTTPDSLNDALDRKKPAVKHVKR